LKQEGPSICIASAGTGESVHLIDKVLVSEPYEELRLQQTVFYRWLKEFFENGAAAFQSNDLELSSSCAGI